MSVHLLQYIMWILLPPLAFRTVVCSTDIKLRPFLPVCAGAGGRDGGGVCAADAGGVGPAGAADGERQAAAGGAGGGAGLPGAGAEPGRPRHRGPAAAVHPPGTAAFLCESSLLVAAYRWSPTPADLYLTWS